MILDVQRNPIDVSESSDNQMNAEERLSLSMMSMSSSKA